MGKKNSISTKQSTPLSAEVSSDENNQVEPKPVKVNKAKKAKKAKTKEPKIEKIAKDKKKKDPKPETNRIIITPEPKSETLNWDNEQKTDTQILPESQSETDNKDLIPDGDKQSWKFNIMPPITGACIGAIYGAVTDVSDKKRIIKLTLIGAIIGSLMGIQIEYKGMEYVNLIQYIWLRFFPQRKEIDITTEEIQQKIKDKLKQIENESREQDTSDN